MFARLKRRFRRHPDTDRPPPTEPSTPAPRVAASAPELAPEQGSEPVADLADALRRSVTVRRQRLDQAFADERNDVAAVLTALTRPGATLRQPPLAAQAVLRTLQKPSYGLEQVSALIEKDPAMSQALLRHANSAWYGASSQPVLGIKPAIQRVGTKGVHATVMGQFIGGELLRPGAGLDEVARYVWQHMVRTAPLARSLARRMGADHDEAFTLGLLHDVGKLVLFDRVAEERKRLRRDLRLPDGFIDGALKDLHESLGGLACLEWGLDPRSAQVIAWHHRRGEHPKGEMLSEVVFLAERIDLARVRDDVLDLDVLWREGELEGSREAFEEWLAREGESA